ncbi:hypothetical protein ABIE45_001329 [Methylobacterium sp. OAE515]
MPIDLLPRKGPWETSPHFARRQLRRLMQKAQNWRLKLW